MEPTAGGQQAMLKAGAHFYGLVAEKRAIRPTT